MNGYLCTALDAAGTTCTQWVAYSSPWPSLSIADAFTIGSLFIGAWALAFTFTVVVRLIASRI